MDKEKRTFCCHQNFVPNGLSAPARGYIRMVKHENNVYKIGLQSIFFKPATIGQSDKGFCWHQKLVPRGLPAPALGLYTCIKALKYVLGPGVRWAFTGPLSSSLTFTGWWSQWAELKFHEVRSASCRILATTTGFITRWTSKNQILTVILTLYF